MKIVDRKISELIPAEYNPRTLTDKQFKDLKKSLQKFGFVDPVLVNMHESRKNIIIGGHQRCKVWEALGHDTVPTVELSLTIDQEQELNVRLNKNTGEFDFEMLANLFDEKDLLNWGFEDWELGVDGRDSEEPKGKDEKEPEKEELALIVICENEDDQAVKMAAIASLGFTCHIGIATHAKEGRKKKGKKGDNEDKTGEDEKPRGVGFRASLSRN